MHARLNLTQCCSTRKGSSACRQLSGEVLTLSPANTEMSVSFLNMPLHTAPRPSLSTRVNAAAAALDLEDADPPHLLRIRVVDERCEAPVEREAAHGCAGIHLKARANHQSILQHKARRLTLAL